MEHAASPSLISLGLTANTSSEGSPFRWGLASSIALHALVIVMAMFVRFQTDNEQPFRTIDVALISLPTMPTTTPSKSAPVVQKKSVAPQPLLGLNGRISRPVRRLSANPHANAGSRLRRHLPALQPANFGGPGLGKQPRHYGAHVVRLLPAGCVFTRCTGAPGQYEPEPGRTQPTIFPYLEAPVGRLRDQRSIFWQPRLLDCSYTVARARAVEMVQTQTLARVYLS